VVVAALYGLAKEGKLKDAEVKKAIEKYSIDPTRLAPLYS
jgi:pyruvate dehydrogenase complex dehydrogenase (E1) component